MEIEERREGDVTTFDVKGKMVGGEAAELLRDKVDSLVEKGRVNIVLNLDAVPDIDSACLGVILHRQILVGRKGGKLKLTNLSEKLRGLLSRTRVAWIEDERSSSHSP